MLKDRLIEIVPERYETGEFMRILAGYIVNEEETSPLKDVFLGVLDSEKGENEVNEIVWKAIDDYLSKLDYHEEVLREKCREINWFKFIQGYSRKQFEDELQEAEEDKRFMDAPISIEEVKSFFGLKQ